jgi:hypothetical protein
METNFMVSAIISRWPVRHAAKVPAYPLFSMPVFDTACATVADVHVCLAILSPKALAGVTRPYHKRALFLHGRTAARHTSRDFVAFLAEVVSLCSSRQQIHIILDNLSAHKTQLVRDFLQQHPRVRLHFTPTYSSWLNQVEIGFAKIEREVIARGIFTSVPDLARKLRRYINAYSANARPIQWKYSDPSRRLTTNEFTATVH